MAEGFAHHWGGMAIRAWSAGSTPSGQVNPKAVHAMSEAGITLAGHASKGIEDLPPQDWDAVITMGCGDACPPLNGKLIEDWPIPDPKDLDQENFAQVRDDIGERVKDLLNRLGISAQTKPPC